MARAVSVERSNITTANSNTQVERTTIGCPMMNVFVCGGPHSGLQHCTYTSSVSSDLTAELLYRYGLHTAVGIGMAVGLGYNWY